MYVLLFFLNINARSLKMQSLLFQFLFFLSLLHILSPSSKKNVVMFSFPGPSY